MPGMKTGCHVVPPSFVQLDTRPRAPPSFQRSCWYAPTMLLAFVGLIVERISGSAFMKRMLPACCCAATLSSVHPVNGLGPDARIGPAAAAVATTASVATLAAPSVMRLFPIESSFLGCG